MKISVKTILGGLALATVLLGSIEAASAGSHRIAICNAIRNVDVVSFKVRGGTVSGFKRVKPLKCQEVSVTTGDGKCAAWAVARIEDNNAASAFINACGGSYAVILRTQTGQGTAANLNLVPLK